MNLIEENCKKCKNYEICQSTGCAIKIQIENLLKTNDHCSQALNEIKDKLLCYGETFDTKVHQEFQKECLEIIERSNRE